MDENKEHFNVTYNIDCMEYMKSLPDNAFDLCVVDPPYGDGNGDNTRFDDRHGSGRFDKYATAERERERERRTLPRTW